MDNMDKPVFRLMEPAHIPELVRLDKEVFFDPWSAASFAGSLEQNTCRVLSDGKGLLGYFIFSSVFNEAELLHIAVRKDAQGAGFGALLMQEMLRLGDEKGVSDWFLEVNEKNKSALALYRRFGFELLGRRRGYYPGPEGREDALTMKLTGRGHDRSAP